LQAEAVGCRVEVALYGEFSEADIHAALTALTAAAPLTWTDVGGWARLRRVDEGQLLPPQFDNPGGAHIAVAGEGDRQGPGTVILIRWESEDLRAEHSLQQKRGQIARRNAKLGVSAAVVVIDVSAVGGVREWPVLIAALSGADYAEIGAIAFFDQGSYGPAEAIRRRWRLVVNPRAQHPVPEQLFMAIDALDESRLWGHDRLPRLSMTAEEHVTPG
jgi:hypothetical protein